MCLLSQIEKAKVIQTSLFVSGLSTFLQSLFGTRLPSVVVGSYTYVIPTTSIVLSRRYTTILDPDEVSPRSSLFIIIIIFFLKTEFLSALSFLLLFLFFIFIFFPEVYTNNERYTRCYNHNRVFSDINGFPRLVEKCCKVGYLS